MKRYIIERAEIILKLTAVCFVLPFVMSLFMLGQNNGCMLLLMIAGMAAVFFSVLMLPCIPFAAMIRRQEKRGCPFESGEACLLSKGMTGTYLGTEWLIYAGSVALHYTQCKSVRGKRTPSGRAKHAIVVETMEGHIYQWPLSRQKVMQGQDWLKQKEGEIR